MKTKRNKLPAKKASLLATAAPVGLDVAPETDTGEDEDGDQLVRTSERRCLARGESVGSRILGRTSR